MPIKCPSGIKYRQRKINKTKRQRLAFCGRKVVEVTGYKKRDGTWVRGYTKKIK
jgi:hypothetical protein